MRVVWSPQAIDDLLSVRQYIERDNPRAAGRVAAAIVSFVERQLTRFPRSGREGRVAGTRELIVPKLPFVVPYRLIENRIEIVRVYHTSRSWPESL